MNRISWWRTTFGEEEISKIAESIRNECVSQGRVTTEFEQKLSEFLEAEHAVAVSSGSTALLLALMTVGIESGDEVIIPNRTWIATAHAVHLLGAKVVLVDVQPNLPIMDVTLVEQAITSRTKAIIPVHLNGRSVDMRTIRKIAEKYELYVIEDAAQAIASRNGEGYLGTQSDIGCFSLSVPKIISTGQGGFAVTSNKDLAHKMRFIRTHGVANVIDPKRWVMPGFNFRFTDVQASIGLEQLKRLPERVQYLKELYSIYSEGLQASPFRLIPVNLDQGEVPLYNEFLVKQREQWIQRLDSVGIETRPFYPDIDKAPYLTQLGHDFVNSRNYETQGVCLPSGPSQDKENVEFVINKVTAFSENLDAE
jgi:perosamine synthetase